MGSSRGRRLQVRRGALTVWVIAAMHGGLARAATPAASPVRGASTVHPVTKLLPAPDVRGMPELRLAHGMLRTVTLTGPAHDFTARVHVWRLAANDSVTPVQVLYVMAGLELFDAHAAPDGEEWGVDEFLSEGGTGIPPLLVVAVEPGPDALRDLAPPGSRSDGRGAAYAQFITGTVKPYVDTHWNTRRDAASNWIAGEDAGGAFAVYMAWTASQVFGTGIALGLPAPERDIPAWCRTLPPSPGPRLWIDRVTSAVEAPSTTAIDAALGRGARVEIRQAGPQVARIVRLAAALRFAARP